MAEPKPSPKGGAAVLGTKVKTPPRGIVRKPGTAAPKVNARERPGAMPLPVRQDVHAFTPAPVFDRWSADAAGVRAVAIDDNVITVFDVIGEDFWSGGGVTAKKIAAQLRAIGERPVEVQINSPGGDMFEGIAIFNTLREHPQPVTVKVMGMAASAASIIAMAGDRIEIGTASFLMIHNCWVMAVGNRHDMAETAEWLAPFDAAMTALYAQRTGHKTEEVAKWMDAETYMSGAQAIERGFADALLASDTMKDDPDARIRDRDVNALRAMERQLLATGMSRVDARERINKIRGMSDSAPEAGMSDSVGAEDWSGLAGLLANLKP